MEGYNQIKIKMIRQILICGACYKLFVEQLRLCVNKILKKLGV